MALKIEKLKAPLSRGPEGPGLQMNGALYMQPNMDLGGIYDGSLRKK